MEIKKYILTPIKTIGEDNKECYLVEVNSPKPLLKNGLKHARHFFITYKTQEELEKVLSEFVVKEDGATSN